MNKPIKWKTLLPSQKGALLLGRHEGRKIWVYAGPTRRWIEMGDEDFDDDMAYCMDAGPFKRTVELYFFKDEESGEWRHWDGVKSTHVIRFEESDGEPDCDSVKMERL